VEPRRAKNVAGYSIWFRAYVKTTTQHTSETIPIALPGCCQMAK
jgi:hypothetical protein